MRAARPSAEIETVEVLMQPMRAVRDRVFMIPAISAGGKRWYHAPTLEEMLAALEVESTPVDR